MACRVVDKPAARPRRALVICGATVFIGLLQASAIEAQPQTGAPSARFEVASLKPGQPLGAADSININLGTLNHGTLTMTNTSLADCLRYAFNLTNNEQLSGPDWIKSKVVRFDIVAKAPADTPFDRIRLMLQSLLTERFRLALHREQKELSYVALIIGKKGPRVQEAVPDSDASGNKFIAGRIVSNHISMTTLAMLLSRFSGQTVLDMTGLSGLYDLKLEWTPETTPANAGAATDAEDRPSLFGAVEQQLGLKLEVRKGPVEILVIDHADRVPSEN